MKNNPGFTLIETIIYLALFSIVIGGGMVAAFQVIQSANASNNHIIVQEEGNFLLRKIDWALTGAKFICVPASGSGDILVVTQNDCFIISSLLTFDIDSGNLRLQRGNQPQVILNSSSVAVATSSVPAPPFLFKRDASIVTASFKLTSVHAGKPAMQNFSITKYLR